METQTSEAIKQAVADFYAALDAMFTGDLEPMKKVWSHADDVTYLGPDGSFLVGWDKVLPDWERQAAMNLGGQVEARDLHIIANEGLAIVSHRGIGRNTNTGSEVSEVNLRATTHLRKEGGEWKVIGHQTDLLPYL